MNRIVSIKINTLFLSAILVLGTIATISPSFMVGTAQALPYYGMENDYKKSNGKDVSVKSIKCNNINVNVNGLELNLTSVPFLSGLLASEAHEGERGASSYGSGSGGSYDDKSRSDGDFKFVCINNNNNTVVVVEEPPVEDECEECFNTNTTLAGIITDILEVPGPISLFPVFPDISIGADVETIAQLCDFLEEQITEGNIPQSGLIDIILRILEINPEISEGVLEESVEALVECLSDIDFG